MINHSETFAKYVIYEDELRMARIRHSVVADKDDIYDVGQITSFQRIMQIFGKDVHRTKNPLEDHEKTEQQGRWLLPTSTSSDFGPARCPA